MPWWVWTAAGLGLVGLLGGTAVATFKDRSEWANYVWAQLGVVFPGLSPAARAIILAHAAYESGWGSGRAAKKGNNIFNVTAGPAWTGAKWVDVGGDKDGAGRLITQTWRIYPSIADALRDYWTFLGGRYIAARNSLQAGDLEGFVNNLHARGYFTLNPSQYLAGMKARLGQVQPYISGVA